MIIAAAKLPGCPHATYQRFSGGGRFTSQRVCPIDAKPVSQTGDEMGIYICPDGHRVFAERMDPSYCDCSVWWYVRLADYGDPR